MKKLGATQEKEQAQAQEPAAAKQLDLSRKTTGEKYYDWVQFLVGKVWIMFFTAVIAFAAHPKYGKDKYLGVPNIFKKIQAAFEDIILHNKVTIKGHTYEKKIFPLGEQYGKMSDKIAERLERIGHAAANTMVLFWGGNIFSPVMKWMENSKEGISNFFNKHRGNPGEVEVAHERLKDTPQQTWGDIVKGRLGAWGIVFASFMSLDWIVGKNSATKQFRFDWYEELVGRWMAGLTKKGKELNIGLPKKTGIPITQPLAGEAAKNRTYRFGKIVALDVYATTAAILIWNAISRRLAKKRMKANGHGDHGHEQENTVGNETEIISSSQPVETNRRFAASHCPTCPGGYAQAVAEQRHAAEETGPALTA